jgi:RNA polymerase sigma factor (sigma-70 family)
MTPRVLIEPARLAGMSLLRLQSDERLVDLTRAGNERAFEAIVDRYRRPLLRHAARVLPPGRAEDAVQQAFLNAYAGLQRNERRIELRPWLYRVAHNAALNALRENGWSHDRLETPLAGPDTPHDAAERRARLEKVLAAVCTLPERQRDAMILRELEGRSYAHIARELDASGGAVRQLLNRARKTLRATAGGLVPAPLLAAGHGGLQSGGARAVGALTASLAVAAGLTEAPRHVPLPDLGGRSQAQRSATAPPLALERVAPRRVRRTTGTEAVGPGRSPRWAGSATRGVDRPERPRLGPTSTPSSPAPVRPRRSRRPAPRPVSPPPAHAAGPASPLPPVSVPAPPLPTPAPAEPLPSPAIIEPRASEADVRDRLVPGALTP